MLNYYEQNFDTWNGYLESLRIIIFKNQKSIKLSGAFDVDMRKFEVEKLSVDVSESSKVTIEVTEKNFCDCIRLFGFEF